MDAEAVVGDLLHNDIIDEGDERDIKFGQVLCKIITQYRKQCLSDLWTLCVFAYVYNCDGAWL